MDSLTKFSLFCILLVLTGCMQEKVKPKIFEDTKDVVKIEKRDPLIKRENRKVEYCSLRVNAPKKANIRILNIKPKYHEGIELAKGNYLIEVSKNGYEKYKRWIKLSKDTTITIKHLKRNNPYNTKYFKYVTAIEWKNHHDLFSLKYDSKSKLIWAMQSAYVDYVQQSKSRKILKNTLIVKGTPWPKLYRAKIDTLIYNGYFRYKGRNFLFKNRNGVLLYKKDLVGQNAKQLLSLSKLKLNSMVHAWRIPKEKEILNSNPFLQYQKYFQLQYNRYKTTTLNLPILCTKFKENAFYSNCSVAYQYNKKSGLYDAAPMNSDRLFILNHAKNFALITPVREPHTEYEKIIFNDKIDKEQKLEALTTLLIANSLKNGTQSAKKIANQMASRAMHMIFGDPKISGDRLYSITNAYVKKLKNVRLGGRLSVVHFRVKNHLLYLRGIE